MFYTKNNILEKSVFLLNLGRAQTSTLTTATLRNDYYLQ